MQTRKNISVIFGTRPEAIKLAPVILALRQHPLFRCRVCVTAQHRQMLDQVLDVFGILPDADLDLMQDNQTLGSFTSRAVAALDNYLAQEKPDLVLVQGDTTTVFCATLTAFYHRIPVGHVEAGLRTGNLYSPWPEEANRTLTCRLAGLHFAPTDTNRLNLLREGISPERIFVTGNTVIDALQIARNVIRRNPPEIPGLPRDAMTKHSGCPVVLITGHRRENFGQGFQSICEAIRSLAGRFPEVFFIYPVHLNPNVREPVFRLLGDSRNIFLIDPLGYLPFIALMDRSTLILTDSGGIQEEAPTLGKPVLVMRDTTERPEAVEVGAARLIGTNSQKIVDSISALLTDSNLYAAMARTVNPFGDGKSTERILRACADYLQT